MADSGYSYGFNAASQRFIDLLSGRFVAREEVMQVVQDRLTTAFDRMSSYRDALLNGTANVNEWRDAMAVELRRAHTQLAALGSGGWDNVSPSTWGEVGSRLRYEYQYLDGFAQKIASGEITEAEFDRRMGMYANDTYGSFWDSATNAAGDAGYDEESYQTHSAEPCNDCQARADAGWQPIGSLPDVGATQCGSNDQCTKAFRNSRTGEEIAA